MVRAFFRRIGRLLGVGRDAYRDLTPELRETIHHTVKRGGELAAEHYLVILLGKIGLAKVATVVFAFIVKVGIAPGSWPKGAGAYQLAVSASSS